MAQITEDYVSFETAKLLKEKGFDIECNTAYHNGILIDYTLFGFCIDVELISAPTLQMACKWLRKVYNLQIQIAPINSKYKDWAFGIYKDFSPLTIELKCCPTYEEACELAIKYCLENLI